MLIRTVHVCRLLQSTLITSLLTAGTLVAQEPSPDEFTLGVRTTEPLEAAEQQHRFQVPEGFQIELVAAEPDIAKPMNLAFDTRGRLWVSSSLEYPFAAKDGTEPRDTIRILEDTNGDTRADKVTVFADKLNIPIGLLPYGDGVLAFAIPNIWYLRDTDGDDVCDVREVLYGPFDTTRDTHGMCNAFRMGEDGWVYACHGFNNRSDVAGKDGHRVQLTSGNTFRFRPDGSRIELYTQGQVNPFGMSIDRFGDIYTADCHTKPVTLLLAGGCYDSFGRAHDGLGYVPNVMEHLHGSTAIAALALGSDTTFPAAYADTTFDGNVMTSRVNVNRLERRGSSVKAIEQPDLVSCTDPWFRPVDLVAGPDGALYIADFYNRIIGHYEVDLMHPGRDRHRGRIWRLSAATDSSSVESVTLTDTHHNYGIDLRALSAEQLIAVLRAASPVQRRLAMQVLEGMQTPQATAKLTGLLSDTDPRLRRSALRLLALRGALSARQVSTLASDEDEVVRTHVMRALRELSPPEFSRWKGTALLLAAFGDPSPLVRRAAVSAAAVHRKQALVQPLLRLIHTTELGDVHLRHAARIALRDHLLEETWFRELTAASPLAMDRLVIADLCLAVKTPAAAGYIAANVSFLGSRQPHRLAEYLQFASAAVPESAAADVVAIVRERFAGNVELQKELLESLRQGFAARGSQVPQPVRAWALDLALSTLGMKTPDDVDAVVIRPALSWTEFEHPEHAGVRDCWGTTTSRLASDGVSPMILFSSFERGEAKTGIYRSDAFEAGPSLSFFAAGHDGSPAAPLQQKNSIRLCDAVTGDVLRHSPPPRNDVAQWIEWQTSDIAGRRVVVELVDGDPGTAYAWLAAGRFSDERLNPSDAGPRCLNAAQLMADFQLDGLRPAIVQFFSSDALPRATRSALASAVTQLNPDARLRAAALTPGISACQEPLVRQALQSVADRDPTAAASILESVFLVASPAEQSLLAESLAGDAAGAEELVRLMSIGRASVRLLLRPSIQQRLQAVATAATIEQAALLAASLPAEDESISQLLTTRRAELADGGGSLEAGQELFRKNCQTCHQLAGQGKQVGPNLDGIGNRGLDRLLEDVLAPNRNVDVAFRATTIVTGQGLAISGLLKELPDGRLSITDSQARETRLAASDVDERVTSTASPMPANFGETLTAGQLRDLCRFLLAQRQTVEPSGR